MVKGNSENKVSGFSAALVKHFIYQRVSIFQEVANKESYLSFIVLQALNEIFEYKH